MKDLLILLLLFFAFGLAALFIGRGSAPDRTPDPYNYKVDSIYALIQGLKTTIDAYERQIDTLTIERHYITERIERIPEVLAEKTETELDSMLADAYPEFVPGDIVPKMQRPVLTTWLERNEYKDLSLNWQSEAQAWMGKANTLDVQIMHFATLDGLKDERIEGLEKSMSKLERRRKVARWATPLGVAGALIGGFYLGGR